MKRLRACLGWVRAFWRKHFLGCELAVVVVATGLFVLWAERFGGVAELQRLLDNRRSTVYGTFAAIAGSLLGFVIATISIVLGMFSWGKRLDRVRGSTAYATLWAVFTASIKAMGFATLVLLLALLFDCDQAPKWWLFYLATGSVLLALARLWRSVWVLENVIKIVASERRDGA